MKCKNGILVFADFLNPEVHFKNGLQLFQSLSKVIAMKSEQGNFNMASITIRNLDESLKVKLRIQSAEHGCSMEAEVRKILLKVLSPPSASDDFADRVHKRFADFHINSLTLPSRQMVREPPDLEQ